MLTGRAELLLIIIITTGKAGHGCSCTGTSAMSAVRYHNRRGWKTMEMQRKLEGPAIAPELM